MKKIFSILLVIFLSFLTSCKLGTNNEKTIERLPKYDIYYQIFVRSFADSNGDGIGDLNGITEKLDYLEDLGITAIWLTPIHPTISYHGYEVKDYYEINEEFGTMADFENLINAAKKKNINIIMDMVFNHVSADHPWYVSAFNDVNSQYRNYFLWSDNTKTGIQSYESFPYSRDLNLRNESLVNDLTAVLEFYLDKGVSGFRFDAVKHYFQKPYDQNYSNNPNFDGGKFLKKLKDSVKVDYPNVYFVGEYFDYSVNSYEDFYMGADSMFNFEISRFFQEGKYSNMQISLGRIYNSINSFNNNLIDAPFITNHDMDRFASRHSNIESQKLAASILLTLPGNPFIYYGEELGMKGIRMDGGTIAGFEGEVYDQPRRQPFLWDETDNAFTTWFPLMNGNETMPRYSEQLADENSLLNHYIKMIELRKTNKALMYGTYEKVDISGAVSFIREYKVDDITEKIIVIHNTVSKEITVEYDAEDIYGTQTISPYGTYVGKLKG